MTMTPIEQMPKKYQTQFPRGVKDLIGDLREFLAENATVKDVREIIGDLSMEIRDDRIGIYGPNSSNQTVGYHLDWQTQVENAAMAVVGPEYGIEWKG